MKHEASIDRGTLQAIVGDLVGRQPYCDLPDEVLQRLREVADTTNKVVLHGWLYGGCGCLIGTAYRRAFPKDGELTRTIEEYLFEHLTPRNHWTTEVLASLGVAFDGRLERALGGVPCSQKIVRITDG